MLTQLTINNFAIVDKLSIEFFSGMSVITGETGAGKSIALDALGLCLGSRAELAMLRNPMQRTEVSASFALENNTPAISWLNEHILDLEETPNECMIRRVINPDGRSKAFINHRPVTLNMLKELGVLLVNINGQHVSQLLLKPEYQLRALDRYCHHQELLVKLQQQYHIWKQRHQAVIDFTKNQAELEAKTQLLQYQVSELAEFAPKEGEFQQLEEEQKRLANAEDMLMTAQSALQLLCDNETVNIDALLYRSIQHVEELLELDPRYESTYNLLQEALIQIQEATVDIQSLSSHIEPDPQRLQDIDQRFDQGLQLARKHHIELEKLPSFYQNLQQQLVEIENRDEQMEQLKQQEGFAYNTLNKLANQLHESRTQGAKKLAEDITHTIGHLAMENAMFSIQVDADFNHISLHGADSVTFNLRSNLGQSTQPLHKVASGGELSRIALAIQVLTADQSAVPTLIFDEIDVGISGATASVVGKLLQQLGQKCQVICVTHLPQVACYGHQHYRVEKQVKNNMTETQMEHLEQPQRIHALAHLLGGKQITDNVLANAQEMLQFAHAV